jgi:phosphoglycerol transferase MdoB-like AlkP superfamily enzyme
MELDYAKLLNFFIYSVLASFFAITLLDNKYKKTKTALFAVAITFYVLQAMSLLTIMWDMNYHFLVNLFEPTNYIVAFTTYREYSWLGIGVIIAVSAVVYFINKKIKIKNNRIRLSLMTLCVLFLLTPYSLVNRFSKVILNIMYNPSYKLTYQESFKELTGDDFVDKNDLIIQAPQKQKNLVIIFLESFEQNLLRDDFFPGVSTNLRQLTKVGEFYSNIQQIEGSSWTMAGIHTVLCGSPEIYNVRRNKLFKTVTISKLICLSDMLKNAGYYQLYLGGAFKTFSGKSYFLELHGYDKTYGDKEIFAEYDIDNEDRWGWGVKDIDLFKVHNHKYKDLPPQSEGGGKPFNLTILTVAPHAPNGVYDKRCKNADKDPVVNAVQCDDELLGDFIKFLQQQENYKDTLILILPDHLMMASKLSDTLNKIENRRLYSLFLNSGNNSEFSDEILYVDLAGIVLKKLGIQHNTKFLLENRGNMTTDDRVRFINNNVEKIREFNNKTIMH